MIDECDHLPQKLQNEGYSKKCRISWILYFQSFVFDSCEAQLMFLPLRNLAYIKIKFYYNTILLVDYPTCNGISHPFFRTQPCSQGFPLRDQK